MSALVILAVLIGGLLILRARAERREAAASDRLARFENALSTKRPAALEPAAAGSQSSPADAAGAPASQPDQPGQQISAGNSASPSDAAPASNEDGIEVPQQPPSDDEQDEIAPFEEELPLVMHSLTVLPSHPAPGGTLSFRVVVYGDAQNVTVSISGPGGAFTLALARGQALADTGATEWTAEAVGPSISGSYDCSAVALGAAGESDSTFCEGGFTVE